MPYTLPPLDAAAKLLSDRLMRQIIEEIKEAGPLSFARFMALALYAPELGYYRNQFQKFGKDGDFVTAPEISPLFSYSIANHCAQVLRELNGGDILEFGAGSGVMAADILVALKKINQLPNHYYILELSANLKAEQRATIEAKIPEYANRVVWLAALPENKIHGVILANEVLDAMPVHQFIWKEGVKECGVTIENNTLAPCILESTNRELISRVNDYAISFSENYTSEINLNLPAWIKSVSGSLSSGVILLMDYGFPRHEYYHPDRSTGTLMCHYRHHSHSNALVFPGIQDITAHVDFTAVAEAASDNQCDVVGFTNQAAFLIDCDLLSFVDAACDEKKRFIQNQQLLKLTMPSEMGELFKVMALTKNYKHELMGFRTMNGLARL